MSIKVIKEDDVLFLKLPDVKEGERNWRLLGTLNELKMPLRKEVLSEVADKIQTRIDILKSVKELGDGRGLQISNDAQVILTTLKQELLRE